ncbi:Uma2 family endonuclease [Thermoleptolyngbya sp. C42_A2020_037]|uniref:Uma2 family endonuclease n=1 Tax=Thermoleptolyngbya sp. C42_A2020_037 TaxID=2747799 RepID=UPI001A0EA2B2|nr:Uma2 family endonuclease [Thermoleptolyngbya sp. C42_A2020_037]MBF2084902.1 Uma2 family endonuclease [Thermoleptolyngbya sp. C42_A2020_037]
MVQTNLARLNLARLNVDDFIAQYGDRDSYELIDGELIDLEPTGLHEQVIGFIARKLNVEIDQLNLPYIIPHRCLIRISDNTAFRPDIIVLEQTQLVHEPLWQYQAVLTSSVAIKLIAEVVSPNWQNDYARKTEDYALLGVPEYWIADYLGLGGRDYIGTPKQPTITIGQLEGDRYQKRLFYQDDDLSSAIFPNLRLRASAIFAAGKG